MVPTNYVKTFVSQVSTDINDEIVWVFTRLIIIIICHHSGSSVVLGCTNVSDSISMIDCTSRATNDKNRA